jgi:hypothetical protein
MSESPLLFVMRVDLMTRVHPQADFSHVCARCGERVGIYPSGQKILRKYPKAEIVCNVCALGVARDEILLIERLPGAEREARESVDFTRKKQ